jgi:hypothetical protein
MLYFMAERPTGSVIPLRLYKDQLVTVADLAAFKEDLLLSLARLMTQNSTKNPKKWLKSNEVRAQLRISNGTLVSMRVNGTLPYTKIGNIIYYDQDDITSILTTKRKGISLSSK